jgi:organic radical activating enzyme
MKCGYCWLAESGRVLDSSQLAPFRNKQHIDTLADFFNSRTTTELRWLVQLTGGEPLLMPNLDRFSENLSRQGNKIAFYTGLFVDQRQRNYQFALAAGPTLVDYFMVSFHPESEANESEFFTKLEGLKRAGHRVFLRFVAHPARLHRLDELSRRCQQLDVAFLPTSLLTDSYPSAYSESERNVLESHFASLSQFVQLRGGVDTRNAQCWAGNRIIAVNFQTGNITPCISISKPSIGNIFENRLKLNAAPVRCPEPGIACICDVHYQQDVVVGGFDGAAFAKLKEGFAAPKRFDAELDAMERNGLVFHHGKTGIGGVTDEKRLFYTIGEVKESLRRAGMAGPRPVPAGKEIQPIFPLKDLVSCNSAPVKGVSPVEIVTPGAQWSYAAAIPVQTQHFEGHETLLVRLEFSVARGKVGVGCVTADMSRYVGEREKALIEGDTSCDIPVTRADGAAWLIIRNVAADGKASVLKVFNIRTFLVGEFRVQV